MPISETFHEFPWHIPIKYMVQSITPQFCRTNSRCFVGLHHISWFTSHLDVASVSSTASTASKPWIKICRFEPCWRGGATWWPNSNKYWGFRSQCCASYACSAMARGELERGPLSSAERMRSGGFLKRDLIERTDVILLSFSCHFDHTRSLKIVGFLWSDGSCTGKKDHGSSFEKTYESSTTSWKPYDDQPWDGWLVVWNMNFMTFHILGMSSSQLTKSYFSEGYSRSTTNQMDS